MGEHKLHFLTKPHVVQQFQSQTLIFVHAGWLRPKLHRSSQWTMQKMSNLVLIICPVDLIMTKGTSYVIVSLESQARSQLINYDGTLRCLEPINHPFIPFAWRNQSRWIRTQKGWGYATTYPIVLFLFTATLCSWRVIVFRIIYCVHSAFRQRFESSNEN